MKQNTYLPERVTPEEWDDQYRKGWWKRLEDPSERGHYGVIVEYVELLAGPGKSILDVGCGHGVLTKRLQKLNFDRYLGIDLSRVAIEQARSIMVDDRINFKVTDAEKYVPAENYDIIIFNECLYYFEQPAVVLQHYSRYLKQGGHFVISMCKRSRSHADWCILKPCGVTTHAITVSDHMSRISWTVKTIIPHKDAER